jgi:uncharacterized membrane protein
MILVYQQPPTTETGEGQVPDDAAKQQAKPGQTTDRAGFFTDAVFAIASTLLVIEIPRPQGAEFEVKDGVSAERAAHNLWHFLVAQDAAFYAYVLAFFVLWIVWRQHHALLDQVGHLSPAMIGWHFPLLLLAAFLPYAATVFGHYSGNPLAALLFGVVVLVLLTCRTAIQSGARSDGALLPTADRHALDANITASWAVVAYWAVITALVWWVSWAPLLWIATTVVGSASVWLAMRRAPAS